MPPGLLDLAPFTPPLPVFAQLGGRQPSTSPTAARVVVGTGSRASMVVRSPLARTVTVRRPTSVPSYGRARSTHEADPPAGTPTVNRIVICESVTSLQPT